MPGMVIVSLHLLPLLLLATVTQICQAGNHYCSDPGQKSTLQLNDCTRERDVTLIQANLLGIGSKRSTKCEWFIEFNSVNNCSTHLVVQAMPIKEKVKNCGRYAEWQVTNNMGLNETLRDGLFFVSPLVQKQKITISTNRTAKICSRKLSVTIPSTSFCGSKMLRFNGSCYAISAVKQNLTAAMSSIKGPAQLASFSSMAEIETFISANAAWLKEHPYKAPLNLSEPVRLGMLRLLNASDNNVLNSCPLKPILSLTKFNLTGNFKGLCCVSLRVTQPDNRALLELNDCSSPMLSLLAFSQENRPVPSLSSLGNCSELLALNTASLRSGSDSKGRAAVVEAITASGKKMSTALISVAVIAPIVLILSVVGVTAAALKCYRRLRNRPDLCSTCQNVNATAEGAEAKGDEQCNVNLLANETTL